MAREKIDCPLSEGEVVQFVGLLRRVRANKVIPTEAWPDVAGLTPQIVVETVPVRQENDDWQVLLMPRSKEDPIWPSQMHTPGVTDYHDRYVFSESIRAKDTAPPGVTTVNITVTQKGVGSVRLTLQISVLQKGDTPSSQGIRPPVDMASGDGEFCVWRYRTLYEPGECFHFAKAECFKYNDRRGYELVG